MQRTRNALVYLGVLRLPRDAIALYYHCLAEYGLGLRE